MTQPRSSLGNDSRNASGHARSSCSKSHSPAPGASTSQSQTETPTKRITDAAKRELIKNSQSVIKDTESAEKWLIDSTYIVKGENITTAALSMALLYIANGNISTYTKLIDGIRAVAICLGQLQPQSHTEDVAETITRRAVKAIEEAAAEAIEEIGGIAENCNRTMDEIRREETEGRRRAAEERKEADRKRKEKGAEEPGEKEIEENGERPTNDNPPTTTSADRSYAKVASAAQTRTADRGEREEGRGERLSTEEAKRRREVREREDRRMKQILIDGIKNLEGVTEGELVEKANKAWKEIEKVVEEEEEGRSAAEREGRFVAAKKLRNGGIIMETNREGIARGLNTPRIRKAFEEAYGGGAEVKERLYSLIIEFIPTSYKHALSESAQRIEAANDMDQGIIHQLRWMRDPTKSWGDGQMKAHAILTTKDKLAANRIIKDALIIDGRRHTARKIEDDPRRCYRCQRFDTGHTAATCPEKQACANCNETDHETGECRAPREAHRCASCTAARRDNRHASWSRRCPVFIKHQKKLRDRFPENHYRFYPSGSIPWTWERKEDLEEEEEREGGEGIERWTGSYDRRRYEDARNRERREQDRGRQEAAQDSGYGQELGRGWSGWNEGIRGRGDYYRPGDRSQSRGRERDRGAKGTTRGTTSGRRETGRSSSKKGEGSQSGGQQQGEGERGAEKEGTTREAEREEGGERGQTAGTGDSGSSAAQTQRTLPASWSRQRANTTGGLGASNDRTNITIPATQ